MSTSSIPGCIYRLREKLGLSQSKFAECIGVSRQAVQKWESGIAQPDLNNLMSIAGRFNVTVDSLLFDSSRRVIEEMRAANILPDFNHIHPWEAYSKNLLIEYTQSTDEGYDLTEYKDLFHAVSRMKNSQEKEKIADVLFDMIRNAEQMPAYAYDEPSELESIKALRKPCPAAMNKPDMAKLKDKIHGAWAGRICGCLLGKPIEGIQTGELTQLLKETGNFPLHRYLLETEMTDDICDTYTFPLGGRTYADNIPCAPADDDTNYTVLAQDIIETFGRNFTSEQLASHWLQKLPKDAYCTAERVAFCNLVKGYIPPDTALYKNPYREWIGAQIRGDYFGYINPGNPELAAEMAWRDARISHVKNGIYGEMFVAAMLAAAAVTDDMADIVKAGLSQIPATSRLYEKIQGILDLYGEQADSSVCIAKIHHTYNEHEEHGWCHVIPNAMIVATALLYGDGDYGRSICMAVQAGFDTDCNGATVGSVVGMRNGIGGVGEAWTAPVRGQLSTSIFGIGTVKIDALVQKTMEHLA